MAVLDNPWSDFGPSLRYWRRARRLSQLDLALEAEVSPRHVSFMETGRARPSAQMILRLAEVLELPLRECNRLLTSAGFAPRYRESALEGPDFEQLRRALDHMLKQQEPYPALVLNRCFDILMINQAGAAMMQMMGLGASNEAGPPNILRLSLHPDGLRKFVLDWEVMARHLLLRADRQITRRGAGDPLEALLAEVLAYPGIPADWRHPDPAVDAPPVMPVAFDLAGRRLSWISTIAGFGTTQDVTAEEIMIECMFPADNETEEFIHNGGG